MTPAVTASVSTAATGPTNSAAWLIAGLGNPGKMNQGTRHYVGFEMLDAIAEAEGIPMSSVHFKSLFAWIREIGIGCPPGKMNSASFVLRPFNKKEREEVCWVPRWFFIFQEPKKGTKTKEVRYIRILCNKEGSAIIESETDNPDKKIRKRKERTGCKARIFIHYSVERGVYFLAKWIIEHNHELVPKDLNYLLKGNRRMNSFQKHIAKVHNAAGMRNKSPYDVMVKAAGRVENLGFLRTDLKNWLGNQRQRVMNKGEATALQKYFRDKAFRNPSFFYEVQVNIDEQIINIFWADQKIRLDYQLFGDAIVFDTTYRTNKDYRPLGFNNH
ncbi:hypothetical protein OROHE_014115 [Orobanche hederae]